jgi:hypothetical protein
MAGFQIPIQTKIDFLEYIVVPSFTVTLDSSQTREDWMRNTAGTTYGDKLDILIYSTNVITSLQRAEAKLGEEIAERAAERAERERLAEMALRLQLAGTLILFSFHECSYFLFFSLFQLYQFTNNNPLQSLQKS